MQIITGKTGAAHITSEDDRMIYATLFGTGEYVLPVLGGLSATLTAGTLVLTLSDCYLVMNGTIGCIRRSDTETINLTAAATGYNRIDTVVARYLNDDGIEGMDPYVIQGAATLGTPSAPTLTNVTSVLDGATIHDMPLYDVSLTGNIVNSITPRFTVWGVS